MKPNNPKITHDEALAFGYRYDPDTGRFFSGEKEMGVVWPKTPEPRKKQYMRVSMFSYGLQRSRAAWFLMTGEWPPFEIDHKDTDSLNDRWANLRPATRCQNEANKGRYRNNKSGFKGVRYQRGRYEASIRRHGVRKVLGYFDSPEAAGNAYFQAASRIDGEFLRAG